MQTGNQWQRALPASELCELGETEAAFGAVSDPKAPGTQEPSSSNRVFQRAERRGDFVADADRCRRGRLKSGPNAAGVAG